MKRLFAIYLLILAVAGIAGCDMYPSEPWPDHGRCTADHVESRFRPAVGASNGFGMDAMGGFAVGGIVTYTETVCDAYQYPTGDGPEYQRRLAQYRLDVEAWNKRHPK